MSSARRPPETAREGLRKGPSGARTPDSGGCLTPAGDKPDAPGRFWWGLWALQAELTRQRGHVGSRVGGTHGPEDPRRPETAPTVAQIVPNRLRHPTSLEVPLALCRREDRRRRLRTALSGATQATSGKRQAGATRDREGIGFIRTETHFIAQTASNATILSGRARNIVSR